jgi:hypothetical protein
MCIGCFKKTPYLELNKFFLFLKEDVNLVNMQLYRINRIMQKEKTTYLPQLQENPPLLQTAAPNQLQGVAQSKQA